ncbi:hypothetical protein L873DRAFT_1787657 [Choiromyces venosus 120613-1]|uniref:Uncharacterized protein n=1 Tax=Choiromyces venosus 120613-1 TaxID=1336337 RepID=A0A3N4JV96_9PEZI|nr:hypothetical protein L873DRAFT_1787657 [Choiromyces venosus 120613-1]
MAPPPSSLPPSTPLPPPLAQDPINAGSATADANQVFPASRQAQPSSSSPTSQVISNITTSASSLLGSLVHQDPTSVNSALTSFTGSSGKAQSSSPTPSSSSLVSADRSHPAFSNASSAAISAGFKSQPFIGVSSEIEFACFSSDHPVLTSQNYDHLQFRDSVTNDGQAVLNLLSQPLDTFDLPPSDTSRIDASHPAVAEFIMCDDPVDFLSNTSEYNEQIWGDLVGLFRQAKEEVKGKMREDSQSSTAVDRLRIIWGHLRSSKL